MHSKADFKPVTKIKIVGVVGFMKRQVTAYGASAKVTWSVCFCSLQHFSLPNGSVFALASNSFLFVAHCYYVASKPVFP